MLFAAYVATTGVDAAGGAEFAGDEPHFLIAAESLAEDRDLDLADEYAERRDELRSEGESRAARRCWRRPARSRRSVCRCGS